MKNAIKNEDEGYQGKPVAAFVISLLAGLWLFASSAAGGMGWHGWMGRGGMMGSTDRGGMQIRKHGHTGERGDGRVFVMPVEFAANIRTGQEGDEAL